MMQDKKGFLWIGTYDGLCRYDGYKFTVYETIEADPTSISDNKIRTICADSSGNLWIGTWNKGLNRFNPQSEKFTRFLHNENNPSGLSDDAIVSLLYDTSGCLWVGTAKGGLNCFNFKENKFTHYLYDPDDLSSLNDNSVSALLIDSQGSLWVGTSGEGLNKFNRSTKTFTRYEYNADNYETIGSSSVTYLTEDGLNNLWIGTNNGLNKFDRESSKFIWIGEDVSDAGTICSKDITFILEDKRQAFWVGSFDGGLSFWNRLKGEFACFRKNYTDINGLNDDAVISVCEDKSGILWFGTWNGGLNIYNGMMKKFVTISHDPDNPKSLSSNSIFAICEDRFGELWVGTDIFGLNRIIPEENKTVRYLNNPGDPFSISSNLITDICEDNYGNLWIATDRGGLNKFDRSSGKFIHFKHDPNNPASICGDRISQLFVDREGNLWIGIAEVGLDKLSAHSSEIFHYSHHDDNLRSLNDFTIFAFNEDDDGNLWIGSDGGGLSMLEKNTGKITTYRHNPENPSSISKNEVSVIHKDRNGVLWIGTNGGGLNKFDLRDKKFKRFREADGLPSDMVCGILEDKSGSLWISTYKGLARFNPKKETFRLFSVEEGIQGDEFNNWAYFKGSDGKMYFGGTNGLNVFHPDQIKDNPHVPEIVITDFQLLHKPVKVGYDSAWGRTILLKSITETQLIELNHNDNIISFEFSALDFHSPEKNSYAYILEGFDKNWTHTTAGRRFVTYTNLDPGEYIFKVKGSNSDGVWNESGLKLNVLIRPPWWATWWAYVLYALVSLSVFTFSTRFYLNRQKLKTQLALEHEHSKKLEEVDKLKSNFYANISHEFRTPLMLILGPLEKLIPRLKDDEGQKQVGLIKGNAKRLLNLINQLLDLSRLEAGRLKLNASLGNISQFIKGLAMEFEAIAEQRDLFYKVIMDKDDIEVYFDKEKLEKIIINVLSNAFKFTPAGGKITVRLIEVPPDRVEIIVRDTGIGIPNNELTKIFDRFYQVDSSHTRNHEGTGIGLALTKELVELHKGNIIINSEEGHWTEVKIILKPGKVHLNEDEILEPSDYQLRKVDNLDEYLKADTEDDDIISEHLVDKTIVLVVEDHPDVREFIRDALNAVYHVEEAANGEQGLRKAGKLIPDLIISDIMMPKMDGYELTKKLRQDERTSHIPIILLTAKSDKDSKLEGLGLGADDYLIKPFDSEELLARIKNLIELRRKLQEKFGTGIAVLERTDKSKLSCLDEQFLNRILMVIEQHIAEEVFSIEEIGEEIGMSRAQVYRKIKALTGKSPSMYLRTVRLMKARQKILKKEASISEICYMVGFSSPAYFSRCFKDEFGCAPSEIGR